MRPWTGWVSLAILGCGGSPPAEPGSAPNVGPTPVPRAAKVDPDAALGDRYLVIVASSKDPAGVEAALRQLRSLGDDGARARTLASSRFKNLMPCYTVAVADALPERSAALELSTRLKAAGIDNYVKKAGPYVGPSSAVDAYCAGVEVAGTSGLAIHRLALAGGRTWLPLAGAPPATRPAHQRLGEGYDAWLQPLPGRPPVVEESWTAFEAERGETTRCAVKGQGVLTLGTPHFGVLQEEAKPTAPTCGEPQLAAELDCALSPGTWLALPAGSAPKALERAQADLPDLSSSALAELERWPAWREFAPSATDAPLQRKVTISRWKGRHGELHLVEGVLFNDRGFCGGDETAFRAVFAVDGPGLGRRLGPFIEEPFSTLLSLVDVEDDGAPELVTRSFPDTVTLTGTDGTVRLRDTVAYCDCAC